MAKEAGFFINNTVNARLGPNTPRDFDPGFYEQTDTNLAADFTYSVSETVNLAFGAKYRNEEFALGAGQVESYTAGIRGTYGTEFKAPAPCQSNASNTSINLTCGVLVSNGTIPATNAVAPASGSKSL